MNLTNFALVDLSLLDGPRPFDGMSAGRFTDMWGRETVFLPEELPSYVANTKLALASTVDSTGQIVGFPIDGMNHDGGIAAGWIVDVNQGEGRDVIEFTPRWNDLGRGAIGADTMRFFSPTIDTERKVIIGGSLTNWPATRTSDHQILLRPVELSAQMQTYEYQPIISMFDRLKGLASQLSLALAGLVKPAPTAVEPNEQGDIVMSDETIQADPVAELSDVTISEPLSVEPVIELAAAPVQPQAVDLASPEVQTLITARAEELASARAEAILTQREHAAEIASLATRLVGGTAEKPQGLRVAHEKLVAFLEALPAETYPEAAEILCAAAEQPISYVEAGHSKVLQGTKPLPENIKPALAVWLKSNSTLEQFFVDNSVELGAMSDYDLSEYLQGEK